MEDRQNNDITQEKYAGTNRLVSGLGYTSLLHWATNLGIAGGLFVAALAAPTKANKVIGWLEETSARYAKESGIKSGIGKFGRWLIGEPAGTYQHLNKELKGLRNVSSKLKEPSAELLNTVENGVRAKERGFLQNVAHHFVAPFKPEKKLGTKDGTSEKLENALVALGIGLIISKIASLVLGFAHGGHKSWKGKHQFDRAVNTIQDQNEVISDQQRIMEDLRSKYINAATRLDNLHASADPDSTLTTRGDFGETGLATMQPAAPIPPTQVQVTQSQHVGKLAQADRAANVA